MARGTGEAWFELAVVCPGEERALLAPLPLAALWPAEAAWLQRLRELGFQGVGEVAEAGEGALVRQLGPAGQVLHRLSLGLHPDPVRPLYPPRELRAGVELPDSVRERSPLAAALSALAGRLARSLAERGEGCLQARLTLRVEDGPARTATRRFNRLQHDAYTLEQALLGLLGLALQPETAGVVGLTACLTEIGPLGWQQLDLLAELEGGPPRRAAVEQAERLERALAALQARYPARVIGLGAPAPSRREAMLALVDPLRWGAAPRQGPAGLARVREKG